MSSADVLIAVAVGVVAGAYAGLLGVGGGIVMVPAMVLSARSAPARRRGDVAPRDRGYLVRGCAGAPSQPADPAPMGRVARDGRRGRSRPGQLGRRGVDRRRGRAAEDLRRVPDRDGGVDRDAPPGRASLTGAQPASRFPSTAPAPSTGSSSGLRQWSNRRGGRPDEIVGTENEHDPGVASGCVKDVDVREVRVEDRA